MAASEGYQDGDEDEISKQVTKWKWLIVLLFFITIPVLFIQYAEQYFVVSEWQHQRGSKGIQLYTMVPQSYFLQHFCAFSMIRAQYALFAIKCEKRREISMFQE